MSLSRFSLVRVQVWVAVAIERRGLQNVRNGFSFELATIECEFQGEYVDSELNPMFSGIEKYVHIVLSTSTDILDIIQYYYRLGRKSNEIG